MDTYKVSEDCTSVVVTADGIDTKFNLSQVETMINFFGAIRAQMAPAVPVAVPEPASGTYRPLQNLHVLPVLRDGESAPARTGALLVVRSDSFGWFDYPLTPEFCQGLLSWLSAHPELLNPPPGAVLN